MAFKRGNTYSIYIPLRSGGSVIRGTGTTDRKLAKAMERAVKTLKDRREWDLLEAVVGGSSVNRRGRVARLSVGELYDAFSANTLDLLKARLRDVDLEPYIEDWQATLVARFGRPGRKIQPQDTPELYVRQVRTLIEEGKHFPRSDLTVERISRWLSTPDMLQRASGTRLRYHASLSQFCGYLAEIGVLERNIMRDVKAPRPSDPRVRHLTRGEMIALVNAQPAPFNVASALAHCGIEMGALLTLRRRDVDTSARTVHAHGTKSKSRDRIVHVLDFAWPLVERHIATLLPNALLFEGVTSKQVRAMHYAACNALSPRIEDYRVHDARHTYAVLLMKAGAPAEVAARQLGHANTKMVMQVYGKFRATVEDSAHWHRLAMQETATAQRAAASR
jgi:integrase